MDFPKLKEMEGEGTYAHLKERSFTLSNFLHNGDSSAFTPVRLLFSSYSELKCINHAAKNFKNHVKDKNGLPWLPNAELTI